MTVLNLHLPVCTAQVACDGAQVKTGNTVCHRCKKKLEDRNKPAPKLRGERVKR